MGFLCRDFCPICKDSTPQLVLDQPMDSGPVQTFLKDYYAERVPGSVLQNHRYTLFKCSQCGLYWQREIFDPEYLNLLYTEWIVSDQSLQKKKLLSLTARLGLIRRVGRLTQLVSEDSNLSRRVLDFGGGWGVWADVARALGCEVFIVELSEERVAFNRRKGFEATTNFEALGGTTFALINADQVFEHLADPLDILQKLVTYLEPGGVVSISVPPVRYPPDLVKVICKGPFQPLEHINAFSKSSLSRLFQEVGLTPIFVPDAIVQWHIRNITRAFFRHILGLGEINAKWTGSLIGKKL